MTTRFQPKLSCIALLIWLLTGSPASLPAQTASPADRKIGRLEPFFSGCLERTGTVSAVTNRRWIDRPSKVRPSLLYYDVPVAISAAVPVTRTGGATRITYSLTVEWEDPPKSWQGSRNFTGSDQGIYSATGAALPSGSVSFASSSFDTDARAWTKLVLDTDAPLPTWVFPWQSTNAFQPRNEFQFLPVAGENVPFKAGPRHSYVLSPSQAGAYVLWFAGDLAEAWPVTEPLREEIRARFHLDVVVSPAERPLREDAIAYLYGRGPRPSDMVDDSFYQAYSGAIPAVFLRNGWVLDHAEVRPTRGSVMQPRKVFPAYGYSPTNVDAASTVAINGPQVDLHIKASSWNGQIGGRDARGRPYEVKYWEDSTWKVTLPTEIPDHGFATTSFDGGKERWYNFVNNYYHFTDWTQVDRVVDGSLYVLGWAPQNTGSYTDTNRYTMVEYVRRTEAESNRSQQTREGAGFFSRYGSDAARWWFDDYRPRTDLGPAIGGGPFRFLLRGLPPRSDATRHLVIGSCEPYPVLAFNVGENGPWQVIGFYRRKGCAEKPYEGSTPVPSAAPGQPKLAADDGYWEWLPDFSAGAAQVQGRLDEIQFALAALAREMGELSQQSRQRLRQDAELLRARDLLDYGQGVGAATLAASARERKRIFDETKARRAEQEKLYGEAMSLMDGLIRSARQQAASSKARNRDRDLDRLLTQLEARQATLELKLHDAAGWFGPDELPRIIEKYDFKSSAVGTLARTMHARWLLARAEQLERDLLLKMAVATTPVEPGSPEELAAREARLTAYSELRDILRESPGDAFAARLHRELELHFVKQIATKLEREKQASLAGFAHYLGSRGFDVRQPDGWWQSSSEFFYVFFTSGPITLLGGILDAPGGVADSTITAQAEIARDHVSLGAIMRLLRNGYTLESIRQLNTEQFQRAALLHTTAGQELDIVRARPIAQDIHATFAGLYDLAALAKGDVEEFKFYYARDYFQTFDTDQSWAEWFGDIFSPRHLVTLFGPGAIVKAGGKWAATGTLSAAELQAMEATGSITRGREAFTAALRLDRAAEAVAATRSGAWLARAMATDRAFLEGLEGWASFRRTGSRVVAAIVLYGGVAHLAEESGVPGLRLLVDAIGEISGEEIAYDLLSHCGTPVSELTRRVGVYERILQRHQERLDYIRRYRQQLEALSEKTGQRFPTGPAILSEQELGELSKLGPARPPGASSPDAPQLTPADALDDAIEASRKELAKGDLAESKRALKASQRLGDELEAGVQESKAKASQARKALENKRTVVPPKTAGPAASFPPVGKVETPGRFFDKADYDLPDIGGFMRDADEALRRGDFDEALRNYRKAEEKAEDWVTTLLNGNADDRAERSLWLVRANRYRERIRLIEAAEEARRKFSAARAVRPAEVGRPFNRSEIESVFDRLKSTDPAQKLTLELRPGSLNPVYFVKDQQGNTLYVFKILDTNEELLTETASAALVNAAGGRAPAAARATFDGITLTYKDKFGTTHTKDASGIITRFIPDARSMSGLTEPEIIALKQEYAFQRVYRAWLGETDGHLGNIMVANGHVYPLDFGYAQLRPTRRVKQNAEAFVAGGEKEFMEACLDMPKDPHFAAHAQYDYLLRLDDILQSEADQMGRVVDSINALVQNRVKLREVLEPHFLREGMDAATRAMMEREMLDTMDVLTRRAEGLKTLIPERYPIKKLSVLEMREGTNAGLVLVAFPIASAWAVAA